MLMRDMFEKNERNGECELGVEIVSYLYNEIEGQEKLAFEQHVAGCNSCTAEFAALSGVTSSVNEWKATAFDHLEAPNIQIAYDTPAESRGIFARLAGMFSFSPWPPVTAGFAAIAVLVGLGFFAVNWQKDEVNVAVGHNPASTNTAHSLPSPAPSVNVVVADKDPLPAKTDTTPRVETNKELPNAQIRVVKVSETRATVKTPQPKPAGDIPTPKPASNTKQVKAPSLDEYADTDDDTLRLTDLFEEIDTRE